MIDQGIDLKNNKIKLKFTDSDSNFKRFKYFTEKLFH